MREFAKQAMWAVCGAIIILALMEVSARLIHFGVRPALAHRLEGDRTPRLFPDSQTKIGFADGKPFELATDHFGARVQDREAAMQVAPSVVVFGDSQALGWGLPFDKTLGAQAASELGLPLVGVRIIAAPGADPDEYPRIARQLREGDGRRIQICAVVINLGNDIDEVYYDRKAVPYRRYPVLTDYLAQHSYLYLDVALIASGLRASVAPLPGLTASTLELSSAERTLLAQQLALRAAETFAAAPPSGVAAVILIPSDTEIYPQEFDKYAAQYSSTERLAFARLQFLTAVSRAAQMRVALRAELRLRGIPVIDLADYLAPGMVATEVYERSSHHLRESMHALLGRLLAQASIESAKT